MEHSIQIDLITIRYVTNDINGEIIEAKALLDDRVVTENLGNTTKHPFSLLIQLIQSAQKPHYVLIGIYEPIWAVGTSIPEAEKELKKRRYSKKSLKYKAFLCYGNIRPYVTMLGNIHNQFEPISLPPL